jgi:hypothetical protein
MIKHRDLLAEAIRNSPKSIVNTRKGETFLKFNSITVESNTVNFLFNGKIVYKIFLEPFDLKLDTVVIHGINGSMQLELNKV